MKIISILLFFLLSIYATVTAQEENKKIDCDASCVDEVLPFLFCDMATGNKVTKCTADPNNESGLRALKKRMPPSCHNYDEASFTVLPPNISLVQGETVIFDPSWVKAASFGAAIEWWLQSGCPSPQTDGVDDCCLNVRWAGRAFELHDFSLNPEAVLALHYNKITPTSGSPTCRVDCNETGVILNGTPQFTQPNANNIPTRFFYNNAEPSGNGRLVDGDPLEYYHINSVITHEAGHWYGIGHFGENDSYGQRCGSTQGNFMMSGGLYPGEERTLKDEDLCAFRKLYCCAQTSTDIVEKEMVDGLRFTLYPNPTTTNSLLVDIDEQLLPYAKIVRIVDVRGQVVGRHTIPAGTTHYRVNTDSLSDGVYMVIVHMEQLYGSISRKLIISRDR